MRLCVAPARRRWPRRCILLSVALFLACALATGTLANAEPAHDVGAPSAYVDPDFAAMALSLEEEEELIRAPARQEKASRDDVRQPHGDATAVEVRSQASAMQVEPAVLHMTLSDRSTLADICRQLPQNSAASSFVPSASSLSALLRGVWESSGLLDAGSGEHLVRMTVDPSHPPLLQPLFARRGDLREEDLPEVLEATMQLVKSMEVEREAAAMIHAYRSRLGTEDELLAAEERTRPSALWRWVSSALVALGLHPGVGVEFDAFWAVLVLLGVSLASIGVGFAWGVRSDRKTVLGALDAQVRNGLDGAGGIDRARLRTPRQVFCANFCWVLFWLFLVAVALFVVGYIHLFLEIAAENRALASVAKGKPIPRRCVLSPEEFEASQTSWRKVQVLLTTLSPFKPRNERAEDECVRYWQDYHRSITPNPAFVLTRFLTQSIRDPFVMLLGALGEGTYSFLGHHSFVSQMQLMLFVLLLILGLAWTGTLGALWCCCGGGRRREGRSSYRSHRSERAALREEARRFYLDEGSATGSETEEERERRVERKIRKRIEAEKAARREQPRLREADSEEEEDLGSHRNVSSRSREKGASRHSRSPSRSRSRSPRESRHSTPMKAKRPVQDAPGSASHRKNPGPADRRREETSNTGSPKDAKQQPPERDSEQPELKHD